MITACIGQEPASVQEQEERYLATFNQAAVGIAHTSLDGRYLKVNRRFGEILGHPVADLIGRSYMDFTHPADIATTEALRQTLLHSAAGGSSPVMQKRFLRKDGATVCARVSASLVRKASGEPDYFIAMIDDVTEQVLAREHFSAMFNHAAIGMSIRQLDGNYLHVNQKFADMLGYGIDELIALRAEALTHPEDAGRSGELKNRLLTGAIAKFVREKRYLHKNGSVVWANCTVSLVRDTGGRPLYFIQVIEDITERKRTEQALVESERFNRSTLDAIAGHICVLNEHGTIIAVNKAWRDFASANGGTEASAGIGADYLAACAGAPEGERFGACVRAVMRGQMATCSVEYACHSPAESRWFVARANRFGGEGPVRIVITHVNVTERKLQEFRIARMSRIHAVMSGINALIVRSRERQELFDGACRIAVDAGNFGLAWIGLIDPQTHSVDPVAWAGDGAERIGPMPASIRTDVPSGQGLIGRAIRERRVLYCNDMTREPGGARRHAAVSMGYRSIIALPLSAGGSEIGALCLLARELEFFNDDELALLSTLAGDISYALDNLGKDEKLNYLAYYDPLTGLPNRTLVCDRLAQALAHAQRNSTSAGVMFIDLDRFKAVNDTLGHGAGDMLLRQVAARISQCLRNGDTVGRLSGDEFIVMLPQIAAAQDAGLVAEKVLAALAAPYSLDNTEVFVTASIGIALRPGDGQDVETLLRNADAAMYSAKALGPNNYQFYNASMNQRSLEKLRMEARLRHAVEREEFVLHYQPKASIDEGGISGFEALLRWQSPELGMVPTADFIPLLEQTGLIVGVGEWVLRTACAQIAEWRRLGLVPRPIAINLSARQFKAKDVDLMVARVIDEAGIDPALIELELTESMLMSDAEEVVRTLTNLKAAGLRLSVDDFGTGYSSLAYLRRFPIDALKIDQAFVRETATDTGAAAITNAIINLAHNLNLRVVAEGVENEAQLEFLATHDCDEIQGYYLAKPMPALECTRFLSEHTCLRRPHASIASNTPRTPRNLSLVS